MIEAASGSMQIALATGAGLFAVLVGGGAIYATLDREDRAKLRQTAFPSRRRAASSEAADADPDAR